MGSAETARLVGRHESVMAIGIVPGRLTGMIGLRRAAAYGIVAMVALVTLASCGVRDPTGPVTMPADYTAVIGSASLESFKALAVKGFTPLPADQARLVGPTYGVA